MYKLTKEILSNEEKDKYSNQQQPTKENIQNNSNVSVQPLISFRKAGQNSSTLLTSNKIRTENSVF